MKGSISLESIISQIPAFEDYTIQEVYEVIKELASDKYSLTEESGKYELALKIIVLKKEKKLSFILEEYQKTKEDIISELNEKKLENKDKLIKLKEKHLNLLKDILELTEIKKDLEKKN